VFDRGIGHHGDRGYKLGREMKMETGEDIELVMDMYIEMVRDGDPS
jgi:hypothetical protein